ncbi:hypothetical protein N9B67_03370 [Algibacter sp.]|nr:hypothetical protein [Algibacter sp.]
MAIYLGANQLSTGGSSGAGAGFANSKKYSTYRALQDTDVFQLNNGYSGVILTPNAFYSPSLTMTTLVNTLMPADTMVGLCIPKAGYPCGSYVGLITSHPAVTSTSSTIVINFAAPGFPWVNPGETYAVPTIPPSPITVNPATDLGLVDGAKIGYFMIGGGKTGTSYAAQTRRGGNGGNVLQGTATIANASTDLILTPGIGEGQVTESTITGGLTLSTADGFNALGYGATVNQISSSINFGYTAAGPGMNQYGWGGGAEQSSPRPIVPNTPSNQAWHGWGNGAYNNDGTSGNNGDGAIILYYN